MPLPGSHLFFTGNYKTMKKKRLSTIKIKRICLFVLILFWALVISGFSTQTGEESGGLSTKITGYAIDLLYRDYSALSPERQSIIFDQWNFFIRKASHFTEYGIFSTLILLFFRTFKRFRKKCFIIAGGISFLYASLDEFHQLFVPGRSGSFIDVLIDTAGALFALLIISVVLHSFRTGRNVSL